VSGQEISSWSALDSQLDARASQSISLTLQRGDDAIDVRLPAHAEPEDALSIGVLPNAHPVVARVESGKSAERAGLRPGDRIVEFGGEAVRGVDDLHRVLTAERIGVPSGVTILRSGARQQVTVVPKEV